MPKYIFLILCLVLAFAAHAQTYTLSGHVLTDTDDGVGNVLLEVVDATETVVATFTTDCSGDFSIADLAGGTNYTLRATKEGSPFNGNSTFDLVVTSRHLLGIQELPSPYTLAAADVDESGSISVMDMLLMRALILAINDAYPGSNWLFFRPGDPFASVEFDFVLNADMTNFDLITIKKGDVNGSANSCE